MTQITKKLLENFFDFNPRESFFNLFVVRFFFGIGFFLSALTAFIIILNSNLTPDWSYAGFNKAVTIFKVPLGILASLIPIIAVLAANHRSEQTKEQIKTGQQQNIFTNYYKHLEEFLNHCDHLNGDHVYNVVNKYKLHHCLFYKAKEGSYDLSPVYVKLTEIHCKNIIEVLGNFKARKRKCQVYIFHELEKNKDAIRSLHYMTKARPTGGRYAAVNVDGITISFRNGRFDLYLKDIIDLCDAVAAVYMFESGLDVFENLNAIRRIDISKVPKDLLEGSDLFVESFNIEDAIEPPIDAVGYARDLISS